MNCSHPKAAQFSTGVNQIPLCNLQIRQFGQQLFPAVASHRLVIQGVLSLGVDGGSLKLPGPGTEPSSKNLSHLLIAPSLP